MMSDDNFTIMVGNLSSRVTEELLYELFLQAGPLERVTIPSANGVQRNYGFVVFKHNISVPYAISLFTHTSLFGRTLVLKTRSRSYPEKQMPGLMKVPIQERLGFRRDVPTARTSMGKRFLDKSLMPSGPKSKSKRESHSFYEPRRVGEMNYPSQNSQFSRPRWFDGPSQRSNESSRRYEPRKGRYGRARHSNH